MHAMNTAAAEGKPHALGAPSPHFMSVLNFMAKLTGEVSELHKTSISITNNHAVVMNSPIVAEIQSEVIAALAPFPEARQAVIARLTRLDERHRQPDMKLIEAAE